ncbi:MAG: aminotransferase class I/II-fold pyridoxal phosphate-dependent enzyme [Cytophagaceae bacterium]|nr:aminotransferase class I/II-fold pyridoxal phosphate-dependent enzyme [Cytophagaceae bacterium]
MVQTTTLPGRTVLADGQEYIWFSGTAYLGMGHHPAFRQLVLEGLARYGTNWGSSRHNTVRLAVYEEAEAALANFCGAPGALTVSSGMLAGQIVVKAFSGLPNFYAPGVHPALWGTDYQSATEPLETWWTCLPERVAACPSDSVLIATDSVGSPHTSRIPLEHLSELPVNKAITVVLDDSHGLGVFGERGEGIYKLARRIVHFNHRVVVVSSLNKALGVPAGVILTDADTLAQVRTSPWFGGSSPAAPAGLWALQHAFGLYREQHQKLLENTQFFINALGETIRHFQWMPDYPALTTTAPGFHEFLMKNNILTASFPYPTPADAPITRLVVSSLHTRQDLERVAEVCRAFFNIL